MRLECYHSDVISFFMFTTSVHVLACSTATCSSTVATSLEKPAFSFGPKPHTRTRPVSTRHIMYTKKLEACRPVFRGLNMSICCSLLCSLLNDYELYLRCYVMFCVPHRSASSSSPRPLTVYT